MHLLLHLLNLYLKLEISGYFENILLSYYANYIVFNQNDALVILAKCIRRKVSLKA